MGRKVTLRRVIPLGRELSLRRVTLWEKLTLGWVALRGILALGRAVAWRASLGRVALHIAISEMNYYYITTSKSLSINRINKNAIKLSLFKHYWLPLPNSSEAVDSQFGRPFAHLL